MINPEHLRGHVIRPVLELIGGRRDAAVEDLLLGTAAQESQLGFHLIQMGGPACGIYQIEPKTEASIWANYLAYRPDLHKAISALRSSSGLDLVCNLAYQTAIARCVYFPVKEEIPDTVEGQAGYWKAYYNTAKGKGTIDEYLANFYRYVTKKRGKPR